MARSATGQLDGSGLGGALLRLPLRHSRRGLADPVVDMVSELGEIFYEQIDELGRGVVIALGVRPSAPGVED